MILCLDVGNSHIFSGLFEGDQLKLTFRQSSTRSISSDELGLFLRGVLFIADSGNFIQLLSPDSGALLRSRVLVHYVALAHIFGG